MKVNDWTSYLDQMTAMLEIELDETRRAELLLQFSRIAQMAEPLLAFPLDERLDVAGVYQA
ncbi:oxalurate catabolism protein HpxX [Erwinia sp. PK3-005]|uniref:Oxalurate catabolism protein HpxX n=1 Tax=Mixta hanseatica TaxID=2872648 RepID=A0ABY4RA78_9GAMM|nr:oxalurate catabolism protein HpxX [Mixta hanseatica]UQY44984.1 oxalurate catabolism protein HpxX [Mixta hanseatica]